jgi:hypothetical protein
MAALGMLFELVAMVLAIGIFALIARVLWEMLVWLHTELLPSTPRALAIRIGGMTIGLVFSLLSLFFAFVWVALNRGGISLPWRPLLSACTVLPAALPFLFSFGIVYLCFGTSRARTWRIFRWSVCPRALGLAVLVESGVVVLAFLMLKHGRYI